MIFQQMKPGTSLIPYFHVILTGKSISSTIFMTQGHLQGPPPSALPKLNIDNLGLPQGCTQARYECETFDHQR